MFVLFSSFALLFLFILHSTFILLHILWFCHIFSSLLLFFRLAPFSCSLLLYHSFLFLCFPFTSLRIPGHISQDPHQLLFRPFYLSFFLSITLFAFPAFFPHFFFFFTTDETTLVEKNDENKNATPTKIKMSSRIVNYGGRGL